MEEYVYIFVPFIPRLKVGVFGPQNASAISDQLESLVKDRCAAGWEYVRLEQVSVVHAAGCLASLFGASSHTVDYDLVVFRKLGSCEASAVDAAAGWHADPRGRHELRYWDGTQWSSAVADAGVQSEDPL